ncbi:alpha/beta hydrolase [Rhizobium sp. NRK18]|uniref:alpha/beta hydrolase n=1 Tax=Rhizobium sp. NRK18 TaxID=2964667 RepID=UPI0021C3D0A0|nr:alpha/beta hydrolase [Rhizobium sp. NRK18]MCQ2003691.1 alpha/beta hydrolase [Rhizobium sp. NRK18]
MIIGRRRAETMDFAPGMAEVLAEDARLSPLGDMAAATFWAEGARHVADIRDLTFEGAAGQAQAARLYRSREGRTPVLLYIHGGGWSGGSIALNERAARELAAESGWSVLSISYRLAPAHPFPAGLDDCRAALAWLRREGPALGLDTDRIAVGGTSAGANLAMATALAEKQQGLAKLLLFYGVFGADFSTPSYERFAAGPGLTRERMQHLFSLYDPQGERDREPLITPLLADLAGLPPALLIAAECDVLCSDSERMADALRRAGVETSLHIEPGVTHGFINRGRLLPAATAALHRAAGFLAGRP